MSGDGTFANDGDAADLQAQMAMMWYCRHRSWAAGVAVAGGVTVASNGDDDGCGSEKGSVAGSGEGGVGDGGCVRGDDGDVPRVSKAAPQQR